MAPRPPLKAVDFHLLLALVEGPLHGYALAQRMREESEGQVKMMPGNLYAVIRRMHRKGWVTETAERPHGDDQRRRYFGLTETGRQLLAAEGRRMARMATTVSRRLHSTVVRDNEVAP